MNTQSGYEITVKLWYPLRAARSDQHGVVVTTTDAGGARPAHLNRERK